MEILAMHMKISGIYMARQLSFKNTLFENVDVMMSTDAKKVYDDSVELV